jgi:hypothetical protein
MYTALDEADARRAERTVTVVDESRSHGSIVPWFSRSAPGTPEVIIRTPWNPTDHPVVANERTRRMQIGDETWRP